MAICWWHWSFFRDIGRQVGMVGIGMNDYLDIQVHLVKWHLLRLILWQLDIISPWNIHRQVRGNTWAKMLTVCIDLAYPQAGKGFVSSDSHYLRDLVRVGHMYHVYTVAHILWVSLGLKWTLEFQKCLKRIHQQKRSAWLEMLPWNHQWGMATMLF